MPGEGGAPRPNRSSFFRAMRSHFARRGVTSDSRITNLTYRWIRQKGYRLPQ